MKLLTKFLLKRFTFYFLTIFGIFSLIIISSQMLHLPSVFFHINILRFLESLALINLSFLKLQFLFSFSLSFLFLGISIKENREIYAIYSLGVPQTYFMRFITYISILGVISSIFISFMIVPKANRERIKFITVNVKKYFLDSLQPGNFVKLPGNYTIYITDKNNKEMKNILIYNKQNRYLITAKKAYFKGTNLTLLNGILQIPSKEGFNILKYERYIFDLKIEYLKNYSITDFRLKDLIKLTKSKVKKEKQKAISVISERIGYIIPFLFIGTIGFFIGLKLNKEKDFILFIFLLFLVVYISLNYYLLKLIENGKIVPFVYILFIALILGFSSVYLYKKN